LRRWELAKSAVEGLARNPSSAASPVYNLAESSFKKLNREMRPSEEKIGGNIFSTQDIVKPAPGDTLQRSKVSPALELGRIDDPAERAADAMADRVMLMRDGASCCPACATGSCTQHAAIERGQAKDLRREASGGSGGLAVPPDLEPQVRRATSGGESLPQTVRAFFEPRLGEDLSHVRIHRDADAAASASALGAKAYTLGSHIAFASGRWAPGTESGDRLIAHELAHTMQADGQHAVRRWSYGAAPPRGMIQVPAKHKATVDAAMKIIERVAKDKQCQAYYRDNCTAGLGAAELATALGAAAIYELPSLVGPTGQSTGRASTADPRQIAYSELRHAQGKWAIAQTLLHEIFHTCIMGVIPKEEIFAENAAEACRNYAPVITTVQPIRGPIGTTVIINGLSFGVAQRSQDKVYFNGVDAGAALAWGYVGTLGNSAGEITIKVPAGASSGPLKVMHHGVMSNPMNFVVV
jgi:hypothetical protein